MFTGIITEIGTVKEFRRKGTSSRIGVNAPQSFAQAKESDSIAVNGTCLTVVEKKSRLLFFDAIKPTLEATNLKRLSRGSCVNIEPSLKIGDKLGGHFVLGHIDCESRIKSIAPRAGSWIFTVSYPREFAGYIVKKGSIALEGISLTIQDKTKTDFTVAIIPFTFEHTNLKTKRPGDYVNIEFDYLLKSGQRLSAEA